MEYEIIWSNRGSIAVEIKRGKVYVRAPIFVTKKEIERFLNKRSRWIENHLSKQRQSAEKLKNTPKLSSKEIEELTKKAKDFIPKRVEYFSGVLGVEYGKITIRHQKTRWGSCSSKGNLNFNCLLMLTPPDIIDSVVVHELCHLKHMNHSKSFYDEVYSVLPDYKERNRWLKDKGGEIMARLNY
ncbi:MAG: M48 family metallopeptidase [Clostridia bacterium]|nr:M48 family metallopeptidase [Clostridia bacterium]